MLSLKEIKTRISSIKSTRKITSAMRMVASAKLHKVQGKQESMLRYQRKMRDILTRSVSNKEVVVHSQYVTGRQVKRVALVVFSSNTSLCGAFNANVTKYLFRIMDEYKSLGSDNILIYPIGRKVEEEVRKKGITPQGSFQEMADKPAYEAAARLAKELMGLYSGGKVDKVELIYHHFKSMGSQQLQKVQYLPVDLTRYEDHLESRQKKIVHIVEPGVEELVEDLLPQVLELNIYSALIDSSTSEHAARSMAMQVATDNANELIDDLTVQYNKSRQQAITNELLDIVGGSMK